MESDQGMRVLGLAGWSGSGKTTLVCKLIPALVRRGLRVSTMKHAHHSFDVDKPGKDSYEHRAAGATEVMVSSANRWALMHENRDAPEPDVATLKAHMTSVDLLIIEGFKRETHEKIEVYRPALGHPLLAAGDPKVVAIASDAPVPEAADLNGGLPVIDLNDIEALADFVVAHCGLQAADFAR